MADLFVDQSNRGWLIRRRLVFLSSFSQSSRQLSFLYQLATPVYHLPKTLLKWRFGLPDLQRCPHAGDLSRFVLVKWLVIIWPKKASQDTHLIIASPPACIHPIELAGVIVYVWNRRILTRHPKLLTRKRDSSDQTTFLYFSSVKLWWSMNHCKSCFRQSAVNAGDQALTAAWM